MKKDPKDKHEIVEFKYISKKQISPDTFILKFEIPDNQVLGLNTGQHLAIE
jgi:NAD(P)H-flavin reductase